MSEQNTATAQKTIQFEILRQDTQDSKPYWEKFEIDYRPNMNVISALMEIQKIQSMQMVKKQRLLLGKCLVLKKFVVLVRW